MASLLPYDLSHHGTHEGGNRIPQDKSERAGCWYFSRKEIEENSPSRRDGIGLKKETYLHKSYCTFLQDLGMRLELPQLTIATAIVFCHRFFLRQSHAKNDRWTIATVCMFLAGKVEETPRSLKDIIIVSHEIIHKKDPAAVQRIKQKEVCEQQKELILLGERVVLATLGFDLNVHHPYKPLTEAIKKFKFGQNTLTQVAWNFVNDGLRTSLCLQFKPHHIAAGAIFLAAKFIGAKLPSDVEKGWWRDFDVNPHQLQEISNQMLELYEHNRPSQGSGVEGSTAGGPAFQSSKSLPANEDNVTSNRSHQAGATPVSSRLLPDQPNADDKNCRPRRTTKSQCNGARNQNARSGFKDDQSIERDPSIHQVGMREGPHMLRNCSDGLHEGQRSKDQKNENGVIEELKERPNARNLEHREGTPSQSPQESFKLFGTLKVEEAMKQRKLPGDITRKKDRMDEDDLIERELEDGIEKVNRERKQSWAQPLSRTEHETSPCGKQHEDGKDTYNQGTQQLSRAADEENMEEEALDDIGHGSQSFKMDRKRKAGSLPEKLLEAKQHRDYRSGSIQHSSRHFR